ncbi:hypothetical protein FGO68_gene13024 [Halteria grandinella]|uniref:Uncharacterized protein n=1 Tax=Halteria grandinella TaxID=5974 RepID=A0A8J8T853_HALGN|nr:hypothetical protein FGO68_gene13024 [Halteria grandinella]
MQAHKEQEAFMDKFRKFLEKGSNEEIGQDQEILEILKGLNEKIDKYGWNERYAEEKAVQSIIHKYKQSEGSNEHI